MTTYSLPTFDSSAFSHSYCGLGFDRESHTTVSSSFGGWFTCARGCHYWTNLPVGVYKREGFDSDTRWCG